MNKLDSVFILPPIFDESYYRSVIHEIREMQIANMGHEDNGQTSAWYVFSAMGFYPVTPGVEQYVLGSPLFKKVTITLENGSEAVINAENNRPENRYVQNLTLNGNNHSKNWISHSGLQNGAI